MSATIAERAGVAALPVEHTCEAISGFAARFGIEEICGAPAAGRFTRTCVHEHLRTGWLCRRHVDDAANCHCRACFNLPADSHYCPVAIVPAGAS